MIYRLLKASLKGIPIVIGFSLGYAIMYYLGYGIPDFIDIRFAPLYIFGICAGFALAEYLKN